MKDPRKIKRFTITSGNSSAVCPLYFGGDACDSRGGEVPAAHEEKAKGGLDIRLLLYVVAAYLCVVRRSARCVFYGCIIGERLCVHEEVCL